MPLYQLAQLQADWVPCILYHGICSVSCSHIHSSSLALYASYSPVFTWSAAVKTKPNEVLYHPCTQNYLLLHYNIVAATDYNEAEQKLSTKKAPQVYQLHWAHCNFKTSLKTPKPKSSPSTEEMIGLPRSVQGVLSSQGSSCSTYPRIIIVLLLNSLGRQAQST